MSNHFSTVSILPAEFYRRQILGLLIIGVVFWSISQNGRLDFWITDFWYQADTHSFPWKDNYWLELINHKTMKYIIIFSAACAFFWGIYQRNMQLAVTMLLMGLGVAAVGVLKAFSIHSCPWSLTEYGGSATYIPLLTALPTGVNSGPGSCFPGGHASSGFSLMALFFLLYPLRLKAAWLCWLAGLSLGMIMGFGQVMRGAHFLSHNLWSGWWVWLTQVLSYWLISHSIAYYRSHSQRILINGAA